MAWPNPFRKRDENTKDCYGYTIQWTEDHPSADVLHPLKYSYDYLGDAALTKLNVLFPPSHSALPRRSLERFQVKTPEDEQTRIDESSKSYPRDLFALLEQHHMEDETLNRLWNEVNFVPKWVDWKQIERYGGPAITGLAYQSLLGGMGARRVVEVLSRTGGFSTKVAKHRLYETTQLVLQVTRSLRSIQPGGEGHASSIRVRLLHAAVRQRIMKLAQQRPSYYNVEEWGVPINDLDSIATIVSCQNYFRSRMFFLLPIPIYFPNFPENIVVILNRNADSDHLQGTFSSVLIWLSLPRQGIWLRDGEIVDFIALYRYVAYILGTPTEHFETPKKARAIMESLFWHEIDPSEISKILAGNIIASLEAQPPSFASRDFLEVNCRWLNGNLLCDRLGLGRPSPYYWALMTGQCFFFMAICYTYRSIPYLDRRKIAALRRLFWAVIVENRHGLVEESVFDFKYIPDLHLATEADQPASKSGIKQAGIERRNLRALVLGCGVLTVTGFVGLHILSGALKLVSSRVQG